MLANALFFVALMALAASTLLTAGGAMARAGVLRAAQSVLPAGYQRAEAVLETAIAQRERDGTLADPLPGFTPLPPACADAQTPCRYRVSASIALSALSTQSVCSAARTNCAQNVQANPYVDERRVAARITVNVIAPDGTILVTRSREIALRAFDVAPYVAIAGGRDATFDGFSGAGTAGDDGGLPAATPNPCASASADGDTVVRVAYRNAVTAACSDGSDWRDGAYDAAPPD